VTIMAPAPSRSWVVWLAIAVGGLGPLAARGADPPAPTPPEGQARAPDAAEQEEELKRRKEERRRFQGQEPITARPSSFIFNPGEPPRIVWRDVDDVRRMGADGALRVRWFDAALDEVATPDRPGRWGAWIEGTAPNGTPVRRAMTFYGRPPGFLLYFPPETAVALGPLPGPIAPEV